ncbi:MAG: hypothetical protein QG641_1054 [Candidatus Poribacteria bacterium]|nr:hypothetical protein [Candidatus Poribacteria bacterium]
MARFRLTLTAPTEYGVQTFDNDPEVWTETNASKTETNRYTSDPIRDSVMRIKGVTWTLGNGYTLGNGMYLDDSPLGKNEGAYQDFSVTPGVRYAFASLYKIELGELEIVFYDQTEGFVIKTVSLTDVVPPTNGGIWKSYETNITIPDGCNIIRIKFLQSNDPHSGPFYIDNVSFNSNVILSDPDSYNRVPMRIGAFHQTLSGRRIYDLRAIHYDFQLRWNYFDAVQYENFREVFYSNELLYFDDGDVPPLIDSETIDDNDTYSFAGVSNPSSTHKAYIDNSNYLPSGMNDFEASEYSTADYQAIGDDDDDYKETSNPNAGYYLYHKFLVKSSILQSNVQRFRIMVKASSDDSSSANLDGCILYAWDGGNWMELARSSNSSKNYLTYSTAERLIASRLVNQSDSYIRLLLRSINSHNGSNTLNLRVYFVEVEINEDLDSIIRLSHKAILDDNGDVIYVNNLSKGTTLSLNTDYTIAIDKRSITIIGQDSGDIIEVKYNRYFEVMFSSIPEEWLSGDPESNRTRRVEIALHTLSESK